MSLAYVDTSWLVAIGLTERGSAALARRLESFDMQASSNLLEAELRATFYREGVPYAPPLLRGITWIMPQAALSQELDRVLAAGYLRGADLWHVACALSIAESPAEVTFLTLDDRQREVAALLGFLT